MTLILAPSSILHSGVSDTGSDFYSSTLKISVFYKVGSYTTFGGRKKFNEVAGLGQGWLLRSQNSLANIQREEGSPSSGSCCSQTRSTYNSFRNEAAEIERANAEANSWRHTSNYVEARGTLVPATEYLTRAVNIAERDGVLWGQLLSLVRSACHHNL